MPPGRGHKPQQVTPAPAVAPAGVGSDSSDQTQLGNQEVVRRSGIEAAQGEESSPESGVEAQGAGGVAASGPPPTGPGGDQTGGGAGEPVGASEQTVGDIGVTGESGMSGQQPVFAAPPPVASPTPTVEAGTVPSLDSIDEALNDTALPEVAEESWDLSWLEDLGIGGLRVAEGATERLIPVYGFYDVIRDGWNRTGDKLEMAPAPTESVGAAVLMFLIELGEMLTAVGGILRHLGYLVSLCSWAAGFSVVVDGPIGPVVSLLAGCCGEVIAVFALIADFCATIVHLLSAAWALLCGALTDDPINRQRYLNVGAMETEDSMLGLVDVVGDVVGICTLNYVPAGVSSELVKAVIKPVAQVTARGIIKRVVASTFEGVLEDEDQRWFELPRDEQGRPVKSMEFPHLSRSLFSNGFLFWTDETAWWQDKPAVEAVVAGQDSGPATAQVDSVLKGDSRSTGAALDAWALPGIVASADHSPAAVSRLVEVESGLSGALIEMETSVGDNEHQQGVMASIQAAAEQGVAVATGQAEHNDGLARSSESAVAQYATATSAQDGVQEQLSGVSGAMGQMGSPLQQAMGLSMPSAGASDGGLVDQAVAWASEQALSLVMGRLTPSVGDVQGSAGALSTQSSGLSSGAAGIGSSLTGVDAEVSARSEESSQNAADAKARSASAQAQAAEQAGFAAVAAASIVDLEKEQAETEAAKASIVVHLADVKAERERQESANDAFRAQHGETILEAERRIAAGEGPPVQQSDADMLGEAFDAVQDDSEAVRRDASALAAMDAGFADTLEASEEARMGRLMGIVGKGMAAVGTSDWASVDLARQALRDAAATNDGLRVHIKQQATSLLVMGDAKEGQGREQAHG